MPKVHFLNESITVEVEKGAVLLDIANENGIQIYRGMWPSLNCDGLGICGRCKIWVVGDPDNVSKPSLTERFRRVRGDMRLACKVHVLGDVDIRTRPIGPAFVTLKTPQGEPSYLAEAEKKLVQAKEEQKKAAAKKAAMLKKKKEAAAKKAAEEKAKAEAEAKAEAKAEAEAKEAEGQETQAEAKPAGEAAKPPPPPPAAK